MILSAENRSEDPAGSEGSMQLPGPSQETSNNEIENKGHSSLTEIVDILSFFKDPTNKNNNKDSGTGVKPSEPSATTITKQHGKIYRRGHTDNWACHNCKQKGDRWFMQQHECKGQK
jgi:hypothetical protein